ncbi:hypothetical protein FJY71_04260, partial [candidate division WOR-3 bacterium]|nr:hypothetical protein [candidate division WOR-3 bacterium]
MSSDGGANWTTMERWMAEGGEMAISPVDQDVVVTTGYLVEQSVGHMAVSITLDGGLTWSHYVDDVGYYGWGVAFDPHNPNRVFAGGGTEQAAPVFLVSDDLGQSWDRRGTGLPGTVGRICPDPAVPGLVYVATGDGVYRTDDYGETWQATGLVGVSIRTVEIDATQDIIYAGTEDGVYLSEDGGATWTAFNDNLEPADVLSLVLTGGYCPMLFAGTNGGGIFSASPMTGVSEAPDAGRRTSLTIVNPCRGAVRLMLAGLQEELRGGIYDLSGQRVLDLSVAQASRAGSEVLIDVSR